jgi:hypothetical protein
MSKVRTFSREFPSYHPKAGQPTYFVEKIWNDIQLYATYKLICDLNPLVPVDILWTFWKSIEGKIDEEKGHTIRAGNHFKVGDKFSPRIWSGRPYNSKQIIIAPDIEVVKVWDIEVVWRGDCQEFVMPSAQTKTTISEIAKNDGLELNDLLNWFNKPITGQIISWSKTISY